MTPTHSRGRSRGRLRGQAWRQGYWVLEVTGTALATFTATGWARRLLPSAVAVLSAAVVVALARTRPRRWRREVP